MDSNLMSWRQTVLKTAERNGLIPRLHVKNGHHEGNVFGDIFPGAVAIDCYKEVNDKIPIIDSGCNLRKQKQGTKKKSLNK